MPSSNNRPPGLSSSKVVVVRAEMLPPTTVTSIDMVVRRLALDVKQQMLHMICSLHPH